MVAERHRPSTDLTALFTTPFTAAWPARLIRWILAGLFVLAGASKLIDPWEFARAISDYGIVYPPLLLPTAIALSLLELAAGVGLLLHIRGSLAIITGLLVLFIAVLSYGLWLGLDIQCGCFAVELPWDWGEDMEAALWRDVVLLALCAYLYACGRVRAEHPHTPRKVATTPGA